VEEAETSEAWGEVREADRCERVVDRVKQLLADESMDGWMESVTVV